MLNNIFARLKMSSLVVKKIGSSLLELMIVLGVMGIIMSAVITMQLNQAKETRALGEKLASLDFFRIITSNLTNFQSCNAIFLPANIVGGSGSLDNLDLTNAATTPVIVNLNTIVGVSLGGKISPESETAVIKTIGGIQLSIVDPLKANLIINLDSSGLVRAIRPLSFPINLNSSGPLNDTTIIGCMGEFSGEYVNVTATRSYNVDYTNTSALSRYVVVTGATTSNISQGNLSAVVGGITIQMSQVSDANFGMGWLPSQQSLSFIVPPGKTYRVLRNLGNISLTSWFELN